MKFGVVVFPGSNGYAELIYVLGAAMGQETVQLWHKDTSLPDLDQRDCLILPGGFSYGDYLRPGAIACTSPIMHSVIDFARNGGYVWGIGNGFQILCEAGLLPGVLLANGNRRFIGKDVYLNIVTNNAAITASTDKNVPLKLPIAHAFGRYYADEAVIRELNEKDQILFRYCTADGIVNEAANPNGALENIAGICNRERNVFGMMPHPERATRKALGNADGRVLFESLLTAGRLGNERMKE